MNLILHGTVHRSLRAGRMLLGAASILALSAILGGCAEESRVADEPRDWGPLAVGPGDGKGAVMTAALSGQLNIGTECVTVRTPGKLEYTIVWQEGITRWDPARKLVIIRLEDGTDVELKDGDVVELGGGYGPKPEEWVSQPRASCPKKLFSADTFTEQAS